MLLFKIMRLILPVAAFFLSACASRSILRDAEYNSSVEAYGRTDPYEALEYFPKGESGGFITSVEKGWLAQWAGNWNPGPMQNQIATFDQRRFVSISREAGTFLFQESEEGYVPGEHEIVILHLVSALHFRQKNLPEDAKVELRRAGYVLDRYWDDPALRLWLGVLWRSLGEWPEAQVDFRRAAELTANKQLRNLAERNQPPAKLTLHFYGNGPLAQWNEGNFEPDFRSSPPPPDTAIATSPTLPWFKRHTLRNTELRDLLLKSNFMAQYLGSKGLTYAETGIAKTTAATLSALGVAAGVAIFAGGLYVLTGAGNQSGSGEAMGLVSSFAIGVGGGMWAAGRDLDRQLSRNIREHDLKNQEDMRIYRMVRFLPVWITLSEGFASDLPNTKTISLQNGVDLVNHY